MTMFSIHMILNMPLLAGFIVNFCDSFTCTQTGANDPRSGLILQLFKPHVKQLLLGSFNRGG